ncbi:MAG: hypothetical protein FH749_09510 [Firmicutes bacterium]|nr:hypothetical protein [Bacillota bacterium]
MLRTDCDYFPGHNISNFHNNASLNMFCYCPVNWQTARGKWASTSRGNWDAVPNWSAANSELRPSSQAAVQAAAKGSLP